MIRCVATVFMETIDILFFSAFLFCFFNVCSCPTPHLCTCHLVVIYCFLNFFFFFKRNTAYEMRISDWTSDVCSSDLAGSGGGGDRAVVRGADDLLARNVGGAGRADGPRRRDARLARRDFLVAARADAATAAPDPADARDDLPARLSARRGGASARSEEHTSELQSLMRISYAVFCL